MAVFSAWQKLLIATENLLTTTSAKPSPSIVSRLRVRAWRYRTELFCALLLAVMGLNFLSVLPKKSLTIDETIHIPAGYYDLHREFRINIEHPPLVKMLAALPLLFTNTQAPLLDPSRRYWDYHVAEVFWQANEAQYERLTFWPRVPMIGIALILGVLIFVFARHLFGPRAAVLAVALYTLEPTVLAHGRIVQTDLPSALTYLLFSFALYFYLQTPSARTALYVGLSAGLALATKFSMVALAPFVVLPLLGLFVFAPKLGQRRGLVAAQMVIAIATLIVVLNAAYFFYHRPPVSYATVLSVTGGLGSGDEAPRGLMAQSYVALQYIVPGDFINGLVRVFFLDAQRSPAGLLGTYAKNGWWYYFPVAFSLKTSVAFLFLSLVSTIWALWIFCQRREERLLVLIVPLFSFVALSMMSSINIGIRHFLPAYPFLFILSGALLDSVLAWRRWRPLMIAVVLFLFFWMSVVAVRAYADYMTYMNLLASRGPYWYYLSDSNVEWGDNITGLAQYLRERGENEVCAAAWGYEMLEKYGIKLVGSAPANPNMVPTRYVAVGASFLNGSVISNHNEFAAYRDLKPEKVIGGSIYVYRIRE